MSYQTAEAPAAPSRLGRYELIGQLATGGMAEIHLARLAGEGGFEKTVVVKRLLPELVASKAFVAMFLDEGKLVARLDHPNVCEVYELGREGSEYFLVMPFLDGMPATELISRPRDPDRIAQLRVATGVIAQACAGLHHAHELRGPDGSPLGLVHRDVSPSNLFITAAGVTKVLDFGVAKVLGGTETEAGTIKGKTQYMAPEQLLGENLDRRCDVFALGIVLYELATHQRLFKRASDYLAARAILEEPIPRADEADPAIPRALADVIAKALARKPDDRFADAAALATALEAAMAAHGGVASPSQIARSLAEQHADELTAQRTRQQRVIADALSRTINARNKSASAVLTIPRSVASSRRRSRAIWMTVGLAALGASIAIGYSLAKDESTPTPVASTNAPTVKPTVEPIELPTTPVELPTTPVEPPTKPVEPAKIEPAKLGPAKGEPPAKTPTMGEPLAKTPTKGEPAKIEPPTRPTRTPTRPSRTPVHPTKDVSPVKLEPGTFSIDSKPFATVYIDDTKYGITPLVHKPLAAGKHAVRAVLQDGRTKEFSLTVPPGKQADPMMLTW